MPSIFRKIEYEVRMAAVGAFCAATVQCLFFRELFTVLQGNELIIGLVSGVWLASAGAGSLLARRRMCTVSFTVALLTCSAGAGLVAIRAARLLFLPGIALGPWHSLLLIGATLVCPAAGGAALFGVLSLRGASDRRLYAAENGGMVCGALWVVAATLAGMPHALVLIAAIGIVWLSWKPGWVIAAVWCICACALHVLDKPSMRWKYTRAPQRIMSSAQGELAWMVQGEDTLIMLNSRLHDPPCPACHAEPAVHIPLAQRDSVRNVLVVGDRGYVAQLGKYPGVRIDRIEELAALRTPDCLPVTLERHVPAQLYDQIILGAGMPETLASSRLLTITSLRRLAAMLSDDGVLSLTLPFGGNYQDHAQQRLYSTILNTLRAVFSHTFVFPGDEYTLCASNRPLPGLVSPRVEAPWLTDYILPGLTEEKMDDARRSDSDAAVNTVGRPVALRWALASWMVRYPGGGIALAVLIGFSLLCGCSVIRSYGSFSVMTSGMTIGFYSVSLALLFQSRFGTLYLQMAPLLACLTAGYLLGSQFRWIPCPDLLVGLYCGLSLIVLAGGQGGAPVLFYGAHALAGLLAGGQLITRREVPLHHRFALDLLGGVSGMLLAGLVCIPVWGVVASAWGSILFKSAVAAGAVFARQGKPPA